MTDYPYWEKIDRPAGPQPIPAWIKGVHIKWMDQYSNPPTFTLKTNGGHRDWPDKRWRRDGSFWSAVHPDGRAEFLTHGGRIGRVDLDWCPDCDVPASHCRIPALHRPHQSGVKRSILATTQQQGFAGRTTLIRMADDADVGPGELLALRGPWYGACLPGYQEVSTWEPDVRWREQRHNRWWRPWYRHTACFGMFLRQDVLVRLLSRFVPHLELVSVAYTYLKPKGRVSIEPLKPEWSEPKVIIKKREYETYLASRKPSM